MGNSEQISKMQLGGNEYTLYDTDIHDEISNTNQDVLNLSNDIANRFNNFSSFIDTTSNFMRNSYINIENISNDEYCLNIFIDK